MMAEMRLAANKCVYLTWGVIISSVLRRDIMHLHWKTLRHSMSAEEPITKNGASPGCCSVLTMTRVFFSWYSICHCWKIQHTCGDYVDFF